VHGADHFCCSVDRPLDLPTSTCLADPAVQRSITVLLIEDNPDQADLVKLSLAAESDSEYRVEWASNQDLVQTWDRHNPARSGLPELDGYKSHTAISRSAPHILIVILTTDERPVSRELTLSAGAADYLVKGEVSDYELRRAIRVAFLRPRKSGVSSSAWYT
jgi:CheY-like chemotaxis protein